MKSPGRRTQRGVVLLVMLAIIVLAMSWMLVSRLNAASGDLTAAKRTRNAMVLNQAKQALIGYVALQAAKAGEDNPGRLPCPEAAGNVGTSSEGTALGFCAQPAVGRYPWRTIGTDKFVDAASEPLWLVLSPGWAKTSSVANTNINSNTQGQLVVNGQLSAAIALIVAPGAAMSVQASAGCTARDQVRAAPAPNSLNPLDFLECYNAAAGIFSTTGPAASFNDQAVQVTVADIMPALEAAIAERVQREIVPQLKTVYASASWGLSAANPLYPFAAPFASPATASYQGTAGTAQGLLPFTYSTGCIPATDSRCSTTFVLWNTGFTPTVTATNGTIDSSICTVTATTAQCTGQYTGLLGNVQLRMTGRASNVAMSLKVFSTDPAQAITTYGAITVPSTKSGAFNADGSANLFVDGTVPGGTSIAFSITANIGMLTDHWLAVDNDPPPVNTGCPVSTPSGGNTVYCTGWFVRNRWHELMYYAVAPGNTAAGVPTPACTTSTNCLSVANVSPAASQRAILILAGRSINGSARPSGVVGDYLELGNAASAFVRQPVSMAAPFNDRILVIDSN